MNELAEAITNSEKGQKPTPSEERKSFGYAIKLLKHIKNAYRAIYFYEELVNRYN